MQENTLISPFLGAFMTAIFIFSTLYTLAYFWNQGSNIQVNTPGLGDNPDDPTQVKLTNSGVFGFVISIADGILESVSWITPFALVKLLLIEVMASTPQLYTILNLLVLRPVGWITALFTVNFLISKLPTMSSEV